MIEGWEPESGRIRVRATDGSVARAWPGECSVLRRSDGQSAGDGKRRTLEEPDSAGARAEDEVKRARHLDHEEREAAALHLATRPHTPGEDSNMINSVTSVSRDVNRQGGGRRGIFAGAASGLNASLRGIWKWAISRVRIGTPWGAKRKRDRRGEG